MAVQGMPVVIVSSGGFPVTQVVPAGDATQRAKPMTVSVDAGQVKAAGLSVTVVSSGGYPVTLLNADGSDWTT